MNTFKVSFSYRDDGESKIGYETFDAEDMFAAKSIARYIVGQKGGTLHTVSQ